MALLSVLRRWHFRDGMPIREITRRTGLSRNTVRKYLASGVVEPRYPTGTEKPMLREDFAELHNPAERALWVLVHWQDTFMAAEALLRLDLGGGKRS